MTSTSDIWEIERALWLEGADAYQAHLAPNCLMAFGPMGIIADGAIVETIRNAPRWSDVIMSSQTLVEPADGVAIIAYSAQGERDGETAYRALCTSTYVKAEGRWAIAQHQQTPL